MQTADPEAFQKALTEQGQLLGRHQQVLSGVTQSLESVANQQAGQQAQLAQLVTSVRGLTDRLHSMTVAPSHVVFPVSKPDKFD